MSGSAPSLYAEQSELIGSLREMWAENLDHLESERQRYASRHVVLTGVPGSPREVALEELVALSVRRGYDIVRLPVGEHVDVLLYLAAWAERARLDARGPVQRLPAKFARKVFHDTTDVPFTADSRRWVLQGSREVAGRLARYALEARDRRGSSGVVIRVADIPELSDHALAALNRLLGDLTDDHRDARVLLLGTAGASMTSVWRNRTERNHFTQERVRATDSYEDGCLLLRDIGDHAGVRWTAAAARLAYDIAGGNHHYLDTLGKVAVDAVWSDAVTEGHVRAGREKALTLVERRFRLDLAHLEREERDCVLVLHRMGGRSTVTRLAQELGQDFLGTDWLVERLCSAGVIERGERGDQVAIACPGFADFRTREEAQWSGAWRGFDAPPAENPARPVPEEWAVAGLSPWVLRNRG